MKFSLFDMYLLEKKQVFVQRKKRKISSVIPLAAIKRYKGITRNFASDLRNKIYKN